MSEPHKLSHDVFYLYLLVRQETLPTTNGLLLHMMTSKAMSKCTIHDLLLAYHDVKHAPVSKVQRNEAMQGKTPVSGASIIVVAIMAMMHASWSNKL
jgi:hypothetical protein